MSFRSWILPAILALALSAPRPGPAQSDSPQARPAANGIAPLDINRASVEQLERLPGIGPARAALIVRIRERNGPFQTVDELRALPRLSEKLFAQLRHLVTVVPRHDEVNPNQDEVNSNQDEVDSRQDEVDSHQGQPVSHPSQRQRR